MEEKRASAVLAILRRTFTMPKWTEAKRNPFETLIDDYFTEHGGQKHRKSLRTPLEQVRNQVRSAGESRNQPD